MFISTPMLASRWLVPSLEFWEIDDLNLMLHEAFDFVVTATQASLAPVLSKHGLEDIRHGKNIHVPDMYARNDAEHFESLEPASGRVARDVHSSGDRGTSEQRLR